MKNKFLRILILISLCILFVVLSISSYANTVSEDLKNNFFRLHILANSNTDVDQSLKLKVRDNILEFMEALSYENMSKYEAVNITKEHLEDFKNIAQNTVYGEGFNYPVTLSIGSFYFPTKNYANLSLPEGYYDALKIEIGSGKGQNWWCSLFPPLCFADVSSGIINEDFQNDLTDDEFAIITHDSKTVKLKFKLIEIFSQ